MKHSYLLFFYLTSPALTNAIPLNDFNNSRIAKEKFNWLLPGKFYIKTTDTIDAANSSAAGIATSKNEFMLYKLAKTGTPLEKNLEKLTELFTKASATIKEFHANFKSGDIGETKKPLEPFEALQKLIIQIGKDSFDPGAGTGKLMPDMLAHDQDIKNLLDSKLAELRTTANKQSLQDRTNDLYDQCITLKRIYAIYDTYFQRNKR
ncbi:MAG: hypothetical protein UR26_C0001G0230 [candidate division TM6 bacterium GW2011_GWF2_32_72]|nr:MAG: hypothetical protein UR26_C0001G0230 [candidate division TM6 bacterium GW2011_GWF2_32_72]